MQRDLGAAVTYLPVASPSVGNPPIAGPFTRWLDRAFVWLAVSPTALTMLLVFGLPLGFSLYLSTEGWSRR